MAAAGVYAIGADVLYVSDYQNHRINLYRRDGTFIREYEAESCGFSYLHNFIVHDGYLIVIAGAQMLFFKVDPQTDVAIVRNLMICRLYTDVLAVRMERIQESPGLRCTLLDWQGINLAMAEWNRRGADILIDRERQVYVDGRMVTRDQPELYACLARTIGVDRLNAQYGWSKWNLPGGVRGYYIGEDGLGNGYWTSGGAVMITRGDFLIDMTDEITEYGYSSPAVTPDGDVYFVGTVHAKLPLPAPVVSYRLLRIRNTWYPRTGN